MNRLIFIIGLALSVTVLSLPTDAIGQPNPKKSYYRFVENLNTSTIEISEQTAPTWFRILNYQLGQETDPSYKANLSDSDDVILKLNRELIVNEVGKEVLMSLGYVKGFSLDQMDIAESFKLNRKYERSSQFCFHNLVNSRNRKDQKGSYVERNYQVICFSFVK